METQWKCVLLVMAVLRTTSAKQHRVTGGCLHATHTQADEEMLLLEAVEMYGLGNWAAVAEHVGTKGEAACQGHYYAVYVDVPSFPEPTPLPSMLYVNQAQVGTGYLRYVLWSL